MIHHVSVGSNDIDRSRAFYDPLMALLGLRLTFADGHSFGYGTADTALSVETPADGAPATCGNVVHIAFAARDREMVREFHRLSLESGATDDGLPGLRAQYDANYYAAFVHDPDGNKIEAVTFAAS